MNQAMPTTGQTPYFVIAALVAAEVHRAMEVAKQISLIASNARALAQRAGHRAAGFKALTGFIDELANKTVKSSKDINTLAITTSRAAVSSANAEFTLHRLKRAYELALADKANYASSINTSLKYTTDKHSTILLTYNQSVSQLTIALDELARELRSATVLAAMSRIEAIAAGPEYQESLQVIADSVAEAANTIQSHVRQSQSLFSNLTLN